MVACRLRKQLGISTRPAASDERVGGGAKGSPVTAGQPFVPLVRAFTAPAATLPNRFARPPPRREDASPRTRTAAHRPEDRGELWRISPRTCRGCWRWHGTAA